MSLVLVLAPHQKWSELSEKVLSLVRLENGFIKDERTGHRLQAPCTAYFWLILCDYLKIQNGDMLMGPDDMRNKHILFGCSAASARTDNC